MYDDDMRGLTEWKRQVFLLWMEDHPELEDLSFRAAYELYLIEISGLPAIDRSDETMNLIRRRGYISKNRIKTVVLRTGLL